MAWIKFFRRFLRVAVSSWPGFSCPERPEVQLFVLDVLLGFIRFASVDRFVGHQSLLGCVVFKALLPRVS
jgi:hypothetical protein